MSDPTGGILGRLGEKVLGWIALALLLLAAWAVYQTPAATKAAIWSGVWRTVAWVLFAIAWPWIGALLVRHVAAAGSNWAGLAWLGGLLAGNLLAAALLMTGLPGGLWSWIGALALLAAAATYNFLVSEYLAERAGV